jgi:hypothetical protein
VPITASINRHPDSMGDYPRSDDRAVSQGSAWYLALPRLVLRRPNIADARARRSAELTRRPHVRRPEFSRHVFRKAYQAHLLLANGVALELFQCVEPAVQSPAENMPYWNRGLFYIAITDPDVDNLARRIAENEGRKRHELIDFVPGKKWCLRYREDPWGVIEIMSHTNMALLPRALRSRSLLW